MSEPKDPISFSVPRNLLSEILRLSDSLTDRMHEFLEANTDRNLNSIEQAELEALVRIAQFGQIVSAALD